MRIFLVVTFIASALVPFTASQAYGNSNNNGDNTGTTTTPASGACLPVPNVISPQPAFNINVSQLMTGKPWYSYILYGNPDKAPITMTNVINYYDSLGRSSEPTRNVAAEVVIQEKVWSEGGACHDALEISWFTVDGRQTGPYFVVAPNNTLIANSFDDSILWATDGSTYALFHNCDQRNPDTGNCKSTYIFVHSTIKPNTMTDSQKQTIATAVNNALKPYCITVNDFQTYTWNDALGVCPQAVRENHPDCFKTIVNAYRLLLE
ncbi:uncharacterized protein LOC129595604 [Paramacrobiotus metropolitanus]|uniref:uncharacterized protein LOC129595604 n=1 Tax=Paramacrobiotus metropolitanus TaxID=2943436 RepID=UPI0024463679|nr:uncharacterized protein LOC129595604 [Paramacrobiotus metropolitanus]